jgi:hypothetical protein
VAAAPNADAVAATAAPPPASPSTRSDVALGVRTHHVEPLAGDACRAPVDEERGARAAGRGHHQQGVDDVRERHEPRAAVEDVPVTRLRGGDRRPVGVGDGVALGDRG